MISIDNYDPSTAHQTINSPRTMKAMEILGVRQEDLRTYSPEEYKELFPAPYPDKASDHFNQRTSLLIEDIRQKRLNIDPNDLRERSAEPGQTQGRTSLQDQTSSLIERERKKTEQMKKKQQQEIQQLMDYEMKMEEIRKRNQQKMEDQQRRLEKHRMEVEEARLERARKRREIDDKKRMKELEEEEENKRRRQEDFDKEQRRLQELRIQEAKRKE